jgi:predicted amidohydrolase
MQDLKLTLVQTALHWGDADANLRHFDHLLGEIGQTDLIILPEMFNTGFITQPEAVAETMDGKTMNWLKGKAEELGVAITGSLIINEGSNYYNRLIFMPPGGDFRQYDKRHLFSMAGEHHRFAPGMKRIVVNYKGWNILPLICYDLRFPAWSKNSWQEGKYEYDLLIYIANWPEARNHPWRSLLPARAIENIAYVAAVNRVGIDGNGLDHSGDSAVIDPRGNIILPFEPHRESIQSIVLSGKEIIEFREKFNVGPDWDRLHLEPCTLNLEP